MISYIVCIAVYTKIEAIDNSFSTSKQAKAKSSNYPSHLGACRGPSMSSFWSGHTLYIWPTSWEDQMHKHDEM